jgi:hypothetical protein
MRRVRTSAVKRLDGRCAANGFDAVAHRTGPAWFLGSTGTACCAPVLAHASQRFVRDPVAMV